MKKIFTLFAAIVCGMALNAKTLYLKPGIWAEAGAVIFVHSWDAEENDAQFTGNGDILSVNIPDGNNHVIFVRMPNGSTSLNWDNNWGKTGDLQIPSGQNMYVFTDWNEGHWENNTGGGDQPGGGGQGGASSLGEKDFYLKGYRGPTAGDITVPTMEEYFECGILADYPFEGDNMMHKGHFFILVCEPGQVVGVCYMADSNTDATHCTLSNQNETGASGKLMIDPPSATFYLYDNGDGTLELSIEPMEGKTLVGGCGEEQAIEHTKVTEKAYKQIVNGQLRIVRGGKTYDATGKEL